MELERKTNSAAERVIHLVANEETQNVATIREWIVMLRLAEQWLLERYPGEKA